MIYHGKLSGKFEYNPEPVPNSPHPAGNLIVH